MDSYADSSVHVEAFADRRKEDAFMDQEVDILECGKENAVEPVKDEDPNATEYSSSFGDSFSESDSELKPHGSDGEAESLYSAPKGDAAVLNGTGIFKKKKLTPHWKAYIRPHQWQIEKVLLYIHECSSQAQKYDREVALLEHEKELHSKMIELDGSVSRSVPLTCQSNRRNAMKRRKRKRYEDIVDASSYMSNHVFFSYYENKRAETDGHSIDDDNGDLVDQNMKGNEDTHWLFGSKGVNDSLEEILLTIESVQSRVLNLRSHLSKATSKTVKETSLVGNFANAQTNCAQSASCSPGKNGDAVMPAEGPHTPPHNVSDFEMEDAVRPGSAVSSYGDAADFDKIGSAVGFIFSADKTFDPNHIKDLCKANVDDDVLIYNQVAEEAYQNFEKVNHPTASQQPLQDLVKKEEADSPSEEESTAPTTATIQDPSAEEKPVLLPKKHI
uniref:Uncharacterized protein n=1 Tax=Ananas comosus var. bracteatus TaxID=296719 RepID=A0A6V7P0X6_ANACO|nr:unnamed protein product [Ananas comosus var. bracteatus]